MKMLRINLHIRNDVSPKLFEALANLPPRPRAEFLRKIAELGLHLTESPAPSPIHTPVPMRGPSGPHEPMAGSDSTQVGFGDDINNLIGSTLSLT